jgi:MATE family multidrug resistance protein
MTHALPAGAPGAARRTAWRAELRAMLALALPVTLSQVGLMLMGVVDTMMVGHLSAAALAATALGTVYFYAFVAFGQGVLFALDPVVSQAVGAGDRDAVAHAVQRGLVLALALAVPIALLMLPAPWILARLGQPAEVWPTAAAFARASAPGVVPYLGFTVLRQTLQAQHRTRAVVWAIVVGNLVNLALNWVFIYGRLGAPALGAVGSAWSSTVGRWVMAGTLAALGWPHLRAAVRPWRAGAWRPAAVARLARLGLPIGVQQALEYGAFGTVGLVMGGLGTVAMAGHQATLNLASLTFMVPLGVSAAAAVRVGHAVGAGDAPRARRAAAAALAVGVGFMARAPSRCSPCRARSPASTRGTPPCSRSRRRSSPSPACSRCSTACRWCRWASCAAPATRARRRWPTWWGSGRSGCRPGRGSRSAAARGRAGSGGGWCSGSRPPGS